MNTSRSLNGIPVFTSVMMVDPDGHDLVKRTWRERLFTRPWRPWRSHRYNWHWKPSMQGFLIGKGASQYYLMHPDMFDIIQDGFTLPTQNEGSSTIH